MPDFPVNQTAKWIQEGQTILNKKKCIKRNKTEIDDTHISKYKKAYKQIVDLTHDPSLLKLKNRLITRISIN